MDESTECVTGARAVRLVSMGCRAAGSGVRERREDSLERRLGEQRDEEGGAASGATFTGSRSLRAYISRTVILAEAPLVTLVSVPENVPSAPSHLVPLLLTSALLIAPPLTA